MEGKFNPEAIHQPSQERSLEENREALPDIGEVIKQGHEAAEGANAQIAGDLEQARVLQEQLGEQARPIVEQIQSLQQEVQQERAAFDARAERLNSPYVLSPELAKVLKVSRVLKRPLLLEGEPGTGKTSLAYALAGHEDLPIIHAQCKSTTTAQELLYTFDVVQRLQDAQLGKDVSDPKKYVKFGPLGRAFSAQEQVILLIDEVDKAKRDFSNDLLHELDQMSFFVTETGEEVAAKNRPIVIVTSNHERDLPEPVLRRVVYNYIEFPTPEQMTEIVKAHVPDVNEKLLSSAVRRFYEIRQAGGLEKKPSTSEMLDWIKVLREFGVEEISKDTPFPETLLKYKEDTEKILGVKQEKYEELRQAEMPESVIAALNGERVVRIKTKSQYDQNEPDNSIYTLLANEGYEFTTPKDYGRRPFDINLEGVRRVDNLTFALYDPKDPRKGEPYLYELLKQQGLVESEFVVTDKPLEFAEVEDSNELYTKGKDAHGRAIYRTKDGKFIFEQKLSPETANE
jgi:MoxR-like ATPase